MADVVKEVLDLVCRFQIFFDHILDPFYTRMGKQTFYAKKGVLHQSIVLKTLFDAPSEYVF